MIEPRQPADWKPDPEVQKAIEAKLEKFPSLKRAIEKAQEQEAAKKRQTSETASESPSKLTLFAVSTLCKELEPPTNIPTVLVTEGISQYPLQNSFILDSGATVHVCNNQG